MLSSESDLNFLSFIGGVVLILLSIAVVCICGGFFINALTERRRLHLEMCRALAVKDFCGELRNLAQWMHESPEVKSYIRLVTNKVFTNQGLDPDKIRDEWRRLNMPEDSVKIKVKENTEVVTNGN